MQTISLQRNYVIFMVRVLETTQRVFLIEIRFTNEYKQMYDQDVCSSSSFGSLNLFPFNLTSFVFTQPESDEFMQCIF